MSMGKKVEIMYFTDVLCIWAYLAQIRVDELKLKFGANIELQCHFIPVFGSVASKLEQNWRSKGGIPAYSNFVKDIALKFDHVELHPDIWTKNIPTSSTSCHLFLKAIQLLEMRGELSSISKTDKSEKSAFEDAVWEIRLAFFRDLINISDFNQQMEIAERLALPVQKIEQLIKNGEAFAALDDDFQLKEKHSISGSPTLVFNEGRQIIYGNVGYRVIEANVQELLNQPDNQASWC